MQYIKEVKKKYFKYMRLYWWLGVICIMLAVGFIGIHTIKNIKDISKVENTLEEPNKKYGVHSMLKLKWQFELEKDSLTYEVEINNAKEYLQVLINLVNAGQVKEEINNYLVGKNYEKLGEDDEIVIWSSSYNIFDIVVFGNDNLQRTKEIEAYVRSELEKLAKEIYNVDFVECISEPSVMEATKTDAGYSLTNRLYEIEEKENNGETTYVDEKSDFVEQLISTENLLIVLSSIVLYMVLILLITSLGIQEQEVKK